MKLSSKIILLITLMVTGIGGLSSMMVHIIMTRVLQNELQEKGLAIVSILAKGVTRDVLSGDQVLVGEYLRTLVQKTPNLEYAYVKGFEGEVFAHSFTSPFPEGLLPEKKHQEVIRYLTTEKGPVMDIVAPLISGLSPHVHIGLNESNLYAQVGSLRNRILLLTLCIVLVGIILSIFISQRITRPLWQLASAMRSFGKGEKEKKLSWSGGGVEVEWLSATFQQMITERNESAKAVQESEKKLRAIVESSSDWIWEIDQHGAYTYSSLKVAELLGYDPQEIVGKTQFDLMPQDEAKRIRAIFEEAAAAKKAIVTLENTNIHRDGRLVIVETSGEPVLDEKGALIGYRGVDRDITARKQADAELAAEKERLAVTLRSIGDGVITTDVEGKIVLLNKVVEDLTGWSNEEAVGRPLEEVFHIINEQTREKCENPVTKVIDSGKIIGLANHTALIARDGTERSIADSGAPILDAEDNIIGVVLVFRDVTEQIKTEKELLKAKKLKSIGVLAGGIAHDFNNILAAILGNINLALLDPDLNQKTKELLSSAEKASIRAKSLTQQLLTFAKGGEPVKETSSLENVITDSASFVLHGDKVLCRYEIPEDLWLVDIDKGQVSQVIQNIVLNASHAMPEGGTVLIICENISSGDNPDPLLSPKGKFVKVSIQDSGIGMPTNVVEKIFDPYFTTKQEGSGLGLAITNSIINKHGGHISAESTSGSGTTFTIYLPASEKQEKSEKHETASFTEGTTSSLAKILIMDDEEMIRIVANEMLVRLGHEVELSENGTEAIKLYQEAYNTNNKFDCVIMDLTIPGGMGGKEAVHEILNFDPDAKVIVSSGYSNDPVMANFIDFGFCAAIVKPYQLHELSRVIGQIIE